MRIFPSVFFCIVSNKIRSFNSGKGLRILAMTGISLPFYFSTLIFIACILTSLIVLSSILSNKFVLKLGKLISQGGFAATATTIER